MDAYFKLRHVPNPSVSCFSGSKLSPVQTHPSSRDNFFFKISFPPTLRKALQDIWNLHRILFCTLLTHFSLRLNPCQIIHLYLTFWWGWGREYNDRQVNNVDIISRQHSQMAVCGVRKNGTKLFSGSQKKKNEMLIVPLLVNNTVSKL